MSRADEGEGREPGEMTMQRTDQVAGETREKLASQIEQALTYSTNLTAMSMKGSAEEWRLIVAALRAQPERGAEEMREIERAIEQNLLHFVDLRDHNDFLDAVGFVAQEIAALRALPLHPAKDEGGEHGSR